MPVGRNVQGGRWQTQTVESDRPALTPSKDVVVEDGGWCLKSAADEAVQVEPLQEHPEERRGPRVTGEKIQHLAAHLYNGHTDDTNNKKI